MTLEAEPQRVYYWIDRRYNIQNLSKRRRNCRAHTVPLLELSWTKVSNHTQVRRNLRQLATPKIN